MSAAPVTQRDLVESAGLSENTVFAYMYEKRTPQRDKMLQLATGFDVQAEKLLQLGLRLRRYYHEGEG